MVAKLVRFAVRRSLNDTRHVRVTKRRHANGVVAEVYRQVEDDFKMLAPPVALHSASPDTLAASWMILRESLLAGGVADRAAKEAVATGVSLANACPYCADVHGMTLAALPDGDGWTAFEEWARAATTGPAPAPFDEDVAPELIGVAVAFQYYNRMVNVFLSDSPFPSHVPESAKPKARQVLGGVLRPAPEGARPGTSVQLLPAAPAPADLAWASASPVIADAFARAYAAVDAAGARSVPDRVRALVLSRLSTWHGQPPGISRAWVEDDVRGLPETEQAAGRLALVIALASYQVDDDLVAAFQEVSPEDATLVELAAWSSMTAARRISTWLSARGPSTAAA